MNIPQTGEIFEILSKGQFISSNSADHNLRKLYDIINDENNFDELCDYFHAINFILERADEYFFFSKSEIKAELDRKIEIAYKWIDILDFLKAYDNSFCSNFRFDYSHMAGQIGRDVNLKDKLEGLRKYTGEGSYLERIKNLVGLLVKEGFVELENEITNQYKVVASFGYMERLVNSINIPNELQNEIPQ